MPASPLPGFRSALAATVFALASPAFGQTAAALNTRALAATCAACHGTDGAAAPGEAMAPLAGRPQADLVMLMQAFRDGTRPATLMHQIAKGYTAEQIDAIAAYFAGRK